jgi:3-oxoacyl-[acyl-carrier protein] reductase
MSAFRFDGKVAMVTGARPGIGGSVATCLAEAGAEVVLANRTLDAAEEVAAPLRSKGAKVHVVPFSADEPGARKSVEAALAATNGRLDALVHNAGGCAWTDLERIDQDILEQALSLNLKSCFWLTQAALPALKRSSSPRIVITSSITGPRVAMVRAAHYAAAKAGVNGFIKAAALELAPHGITVNGVEPGMVAKNRGRLSQPATLSRMEKYIPLGQAGQPQDIAYAMLFLASTEARWITGQTIVVDGGATLPESGFAMEEQWPGTAVLSN